MAVQTDMTEDVTSGARVSGIDEEAQKLSRLSVCDLQTSTLGGYVGEYTIDETVPCTMPMRIVPMIARASCLFTTSSSTPVKLKPLYPQRGSLCECECLCEDLSSRFGDTISDGVDMSDRVADTCSEASTAPSEVMRSETDMYTDLQVNK